MEQKVLTHLTAQIVQGAIEYTINGFFVAKSISWKSTRTAEFYQDELGLFTHFLDTQGVNMLSELDTDIIRRYLLSLSERRNPGGVHASYRAIRSWLNWCWLEYEPDWKNPILKVEQPKLNQEPLPGLSDSDFWRMVDTCKDDRLDIRDKAVMLALYDTGIRASELTALDIGDLDLNSMALIIRHGKGDKLRIVPFQNTTRQAIKRYLKNRMDNDIKAPLFTAQEGNRLTFWGLREIIRRRAALIDIPAPGLHDFRRAAGRELNNNGMGIYDIARMLGHSSTRVTERYIRLEDKMLAQKFAHASPVEKSKRKKR